MLGTPPEFWVRYGPALLGGLAGRIARHFWPVTLAAVAASVAWAVL